MKYFLYKLIPPRTTFLQDMTESEEKVMQKHIGYWKDFADRGIAIIFGPVLDPMGAYGLAIIETKDEAVVGDIGTNDPAIKEGVGFSFEIYSMPEPILRK